MQDRELIEFTVNELREHYNIHPSAVPNLVNLVESKLDASNNPTPQEEVGDVSPGEAEDTHYTTGGIDEDKDTGGFSGFANGAT